MPLRCWLLYQRSLSTSIEGGTKWLVNKLKGKMQKPLTELLKEFDLPIGIFPRDATNYEFNEETGKLVVSIVKWGKCLTRKKLGFLRNHLYVMKQLLLLFEC
ncbi:uncharacterized protein At5g01610 [Cajanus cajan]|uniref:uncharacterized protein At5g01610 n=1 Tax=Cajanus cajan TaxID=3821 RepID=UPI00098D9983|nr:uncharacterized protein At5g01610 [Cajanus cajan]